MYYLYLHFRSWTPSQLSASQAKVEQQLKTLSQFSYYEKAVGIMQIFDNQIQFCIFSRWSKSPPEAKLDASLQVFQF